MSIVGLIVAQLVISYQRDRVCSKFSSAGKFFLAHGLRQLTRDIKSDVRTLNSCDVIFRRHHEKPGMTVGEGRYAT